MTPAMKHCSFVLALFSLLCAVAFLSACGVYPVEERDLSEYCDEQAKAVLQDQQSPMLLRYFCQRETSEEYEVTDTAVINAVRQAILDIHIKNETDIAATDYDDVFIFTMKDGTEYSFSFNGHCFQSNGKVYELSDDGELWKLAKQISDGG